MKKMKKIYMLLAVALVLTFIPGLKASAAGTSVLDRDTGLEAKTLSTRIVSSKNDISTLKYYNIQISPEDNGKPVVVPIKISEKGSFFYGIDYDFYEQAGAKAYFGIYSDSACTKSVSTPDSKGVGEFNVKKAATYYVRFAFSDTSESLLGSYNFIFGSNIISAADKTLTNNKEKIAATFNSTTPVYYKVKVTASGKLTLNITGTSYASKVTLCNSKKKAVSNEVTVDASVAGKQKAVFGVTKGTYYFKVKKPAGAMLVKSTFSKVSDKSGSSKSKAKSLKMGGSAINGLVTASEKSGKADWYKFTNSKRKKTTIYWNGDVASGKLQMTIYTSNGKKFSGTSINMSGIGDQHGVTIYSGSYGVRTLPKGTYYIKITKSGAKTSGSYNIKVK